MRQPSIHYAFRVDPEALNRLLTRMAEGGPYEDLHAASHPAWLERSERAEATLSELLPVEGLRAQLELTAPEDEELAAWIDLGRRFLDRAEVVHLWQGHREVLTNRLDRIQGLVEMKAPPLILDNDRRMLVQRLAEAERDTNAAPPPTPIRLFIESLTGQCISLLLPWMTEFPTGGEPVLGDVGVVPCFSGGQWRFAEGGELLHSALLEGEALRRWAQRLQAHQPDAERVRRHALDWLRLQEPGVPVDGREDEGAQMLRTFLHDNQRFVAHQLMDAHDEGFAVLTWSVRTLV